MPVPAKVTQLIEASGNSFHAKVARWFQAHGWHTVVSPYYMDQSQSKAREIDLVAEKLWPIHNQSLGASIGHVVVRLFIECKFVGSEAVLWFAPKDTEAARRLVCRGGAFRDNKRYTDQHHYLAAGERVAKLFASSNDKAPENEPFYKALNQVLNATIAMRGRSPSHPGLRNTHGRTVLLEYPVVVCSSFSRLYAVDFLEASEAAAITENFQLEVRYAYLDRDGGQHDDYFLLDFVDFGQIAAFEDAIAADAKAAAVTARSAPSARSDSLSRDGVV